MTHARWILALFAGAMLGVGCEQQQRVEGPRAQPAAGADVVYDLDEPDATMIVGEPSELGAAVVWPVEEQYVPPARQGIYQQAGYEPEPQLAEPEDYREPGRTGYYQSPFVEPGEPLGTYDPWRFRPWGRSGQVWQ